MNKHQAKTAAALLERMEEYDQVKCAHFETINPDGWICGYKNSDDEKFTLFNPYQSEADCWMVVDWMEKEGIQFQTLPPFGDRDIYHQVSFRSKTTNEGISFKSYQWKDRRTAIIECAAEALGIEVGDE